MKPPASQTGEEERMDSGVIDYSRAGEWARLQARVETITQTLFNVRDANAASGAGITDAPADFRAALAGLDGELAMWRGSLAEHDQQEAQETLRLLRERSIATGRPLGC